MKQRLLRKRESRLQSSKVES